MVDGRYFNCPISLDARPISRHVRSPLTDGATILGPIDRPSREFKHHGKKPQGPEVRAGRPRKRWVETWEFRSGTTIFHGSAYAFGPGWARGDGPPKTSFSNPGLEPNGTCVAKTQNLPGLCANKAANGIEKQFGSVVGRGRFKEKRQNLFLSPAGLLRACVPSIGKRVPAGRRFPGNGFRKAQPNGTFGPAGDTENSMVELPSERLQAGRTFGRFEPGQLGLAGGSLGPRYTGPAVQVATGGLHSRGPACEHGPG